MLHADVRSTDDHDLWDSDDSGDEDMHDIEGKSGSSSGLHAKTSLPSSIFAYLCTCVGAGILSYPSALQFCGWFGIFIIAFTSVAATITANYLIACMFAIPGKRLKTYEDIGEAAMGVKGRRMVAFFQTITLFGVCTIFLILMGGNMNTLVSQLTLHDWVFIFGACLIPVSRIADSNKKQADMFEIVSQYPKRSQHVYGLVTCVACLVTFVCLFFLLCVLFRLLG